MNQPNDRHETCRIDYGVLVDLVHKGQIDEFHYSLFPGFSSPGYRTSSTKSYTLPEQFHIIVPLLGVMNIVALASLTTLMAFLRDTKPKQDGLQGVHIDVTYIGIPKTVQERFKNMEYLPKEHMDEPIYFRTIVTNLIYDSTSSFLNLLALDVLSASQFSKLDITDLLTDRIHFHRDLEDFYGRWPEKIKRHMQNTDEAKNYTGILLRCGRNSRFCSQDSGNYEPPFDQIHSLDILNNSNPASFIGSIWYLIESIQRTEGFGKGQTFLLLPFHLIRFITDKVVQSNMAFADWKKIDQHVRLITYLFPGRFVNEMPYYVSEAGREPWPHNSLAYAQPFLKSLTEFLGSPRYFDTEIEPASKAIELGFDRLFLRLHEELRYS